MALQETFLNIRGTKIQMLKGGMATRCCICICNPKLRDRLYRVTVPTLVLWGASDRLIPVAHGKAYHEGIDRSKFVLMEKCGHAPPFEKPEETVKILREFFHG